MVPVYIRSVHNSAVLELAPDGTSVEFNPLDKARSEYQQWYINYLSGLKVGGFMIISIKNGMALQADGSKVKAVKPDVRESLQHWNRNELLIVRAKHPSEMLTVLDNTKDVCVFTSSTISTEQQTFFEVLHIVADSAYL